MSSARMKTIFGRDDCPFFPWDPFVDCSEDRINEDNDVDVVEKAAKEINPTVVKNPIAKPKYNF